VHEFSVVTPALSASALFKGRAAPAPRAPSLASPGRYVSFHEPRGAQPRHRGAQCVQLPRQIRQSPGVRAVRADLGTTRRIPDSGRSDARDRRCRAGVDANPTRSAGTAQRRPPSVAVPSGRAAARVSASLDLDDFCTQIPEQLRAPGSCYEAAEIKHPQAAQGQRRGRNRLFRQGSSFQR
jgi:hypothetical protein